MTLQGASDQRRASIHASPRAGERALDPWRCAPCSDRRLTVRGAGRTPVMRWRSLLSCPCQMCWPPVSSAGSSNSAGRPSLPVFNNGMELITPALFRWAQERRADWRYITPRTRTK